MEKAPMTVRSEDEEAPETVRSRPDVTKAETLAEKGKRFRDVTSMFLTMAFADDREAGKDPVLDPDVPLDREAFAKFSRG